MPVYISSAHKVTAQCVGRCKEKLTLMGYHSVLMGFDGYDLML